MSRTIVFLDSCVLYPFSLRDILIQFSVEGMFQAKWSSKVRQEVIRNVELNYPTTKGKLDRTFVLMEKAAPDFSAEATQATLSDVAKSSTDQKDVEIMAAAIDGGCSYLVTFNLKDFDIAYASARGVAVTHPDEFLENLINSNLASAKAGFGAVIARCKSPARSKSDYYAKFTDNNMPKTAAALEMISSV